MKWSHEIGLIYLFWFLFGQVIFVGSIRGCNIFFFFLATAFILNCKDGWGIKFFSYFSTSAWLFPFLYYIFFAYLLLFFIVCFTRVLSKTIYELIMTLDCWQEGHKVTLNVYDLSQGLARQLSMIFLGKVIEGIW